jgi:hypothetical protein
MQSFNDVQEKDRTQARAELGFDVERVPLVTDGTPHERVDRLLVKRSNPTDGEKEKLGIVKAKRPHIPYTEIMDWVTRELDTANVQYKLKESQVLYNGDMYQEYIFNNEVDTPDDTDMSPMMLVKGSYVGTPMEAYFGTYRFTCANGVIVGETIDKIMVKPNVSDLLHTSIQDEIRNRIEKFKHVEQLYTNLHAEDFNPYLYAILTDMYLGTKIKKEILSLLKQDGNVEITKEKIKAADLENPDQLINIVDAISAWDFYNVVTQVVTRHSQSVNTRMKNYQRVSRDFEI